MLFAGLDGEAEGRSYRYEVTLPGAKIDDDFPAARIQESFSSGGLRFVLPPVEKLDDEARLRLGVKKYLADLAETHPFLTFCLSQTR